MNNINKTAAFYIRVSTEDQTEFSPDAQLRSLTKYAENCGYLYNERIIFIDEGISARNASKRPAFMNMISMSAQQPKPFDVILVHRFDRFARNREDSVVYKSVLKKRGIRVISVTEHLEDDKFSVILESILEAMAEYYSLNLSDEVKKGMCEKARRGGLQSPPPYGYEVLNNILVISKNEAENVVFMFSRLLEGYTTVEIAEQLNSLGALTKRGKSFTSRAVKYILKNPVYTGKLKWSTDDCTYLVKGHHEPIIDEATFNEAQNYLS